jgi:hypothetical protein
MYGTRIGQLGIRDEVFELGDIVIVTVVFRI